jgi:hypothetical protein
MLLLVATLTLLVAGFAAPQSFDRGFVQRIPADKLISHDFVLLGKDGKVYGRLTTREGAGVMEFYDGKGNVIWSTPPRNNGYTPVQSNCMRR